MSLELVSVSKRRGTFRLEGISIRAEDGGILGIAGPNGAGKSTLLKVMAGILPPDSGTMTIDGRDISSMSLRERAGKISILFQETPAPFNFGVKDVIRTSGYFIGGREDNIDRVLESVGIAELGGRPFHELSGGEKRLVMLSALLYQNTKVCLFDEPFSFLDVDKEMRIARTIRKLRDEDRLVIVTMHDINGLLRLADSALLMKKGVQVAYGTVGDVITVENIYRTYGVRFAEYDSPEGRRMVPEESMAIQERVV
ncbi:MAG: ABC transporter ATP-binding protein [Candidatus Thermoplasmatota archaeon]|jgi:iron complex transport system ATP-binding protein|nr:ABC transporter ATP-binding protein [Candidatus Thermoplasmatota archaeon]MCL5793589.1 ABC transporter ATP-binding protein [Candidatus Thermoplasmatota archaeon]